jgi:hypothetical protein
MYFSASASFGAGIVLSLAGAISFSQVRQPSLKVFASIPLIYPYSNLLRASYGYRLPNGLH